MKEEDMKKIIVVGNAGCCKEYKNGKKALKEIAKVKR